MRRLRRKETGHSPDDPDITHIMKKRLLVLSLVLLLGTLLTACGGGPKATVITFSGAEATVTGPNKSAVKVADGILTIGKAGTYELSGKGTLPIVVNVNGGNAVRLNMKGLDLTATKTSPIYIEEATMVVINPMSGTQNIITDRHLYVKPEGEAADTEQDDGPSAAIHSRAPLLIEGEGKLTVNGESYNGISSGDTLTVKSGNLTITAEHHGLKGKDYVLISGGTLNIKSEGDGIKSTNTEKASLGYINITGGNITIRSDDEGIYAPSSISVSGGNLYIKSKKPALQTLGKLNLTGGMIDITTNSDALSCASSDLSGDALITVNGRPYSK